MSITKKRITVLGNEAPEEVAPLIERLTLWARRNLNTIVYSGGAILFVLVIVGGVLWVRAGREKAASAALAQATVMVRDLASAAATASAQGIDHQPALDALRRVSSAYPNTRAGLAADLQAAEVLFRAGRYDEAAQVVESLQARAPRFASDLNAAYLLARAYEAKGDFARAVGTYSHVKDRAKGDFRAVILLDLARCLDLSGDPDQAVAYLRQVLDDYPDTVFSLKAEKKLALAGASGAEEP